MRPTTLVYVAGPFSAPKGIAESRARAFVEVNILRAVTVGLEVARLGFTPVIPHANTAHPEFEKVQPYQFWIAGTTEMLRRCDAMVMVPDKTIQLAHGSDSFAGEIEFASAVQIATLVSVVEIWCEEHDDGRPTLMGRFASWRESSGAIRERAEAGRLGIPVFDTIDELRVWTPPSVGSTRFRR